ncbi:DUF1905 domain-containing protein [Tsuneonella mangrovi]|uniref:DUF1905 domain-containing protein n=1 Tax=Tsuneonella mangrovi TaxID=1982042 RepID=UPI000BA2BB1B|nr:DUF1905 domain-containing protein [Tsuneonella mangrovi]
MSETLSFAAPLTRWRGDRGTYHLVTIAGEAADQLAMHARLHRLEFGRSRGFGSVKVTARIGETHWKSSVFPQRKQSEWILLVSRRVMRAEDLAAGDTVRLELELL